MKRWSIVALVCTLLFTYPGWSAQVAHLRPLSDPAVDVLFDGARIHDVQITMAAADWARLRATYLENTNYDATLTIDGETVPNSSIRSRGSGTRNGVKPGLRVDFSRTVKTQRFHGFKVLVLDNMYNDPSFLREQLAFSVFDEVGILRPREVFARLSVNNEYWGLYAIVEPIDKIFVTNHVDAGEGNLFEYNVPPVPPEQMPAWDFSLSRGETIEHYVPSPFEPKTNEDSLDGTQLLAFLRTISEAPDATFLNDISAFIDPRQLLTYYAVEVATSEVDGLTSFFGVNNFYLYQKSGTPRFLFIPWDHDFNFTNAAHPIFFGAERNRLITRLLAVPELNAFYLEQLQSILDRFVNATWMNPRIDAMVALIRNDVLQDTKRRGGDDPATSAQKFDDAVEQLRRVAVSRGTFVYAQMHPGRRRGVRP
jgi:spore coat protein CotH